MKYRFPVFRTTKYATNKKKYVGLPKIEIKPTMEFTASAIAQFLQGVVEGNQEVKVNNIAKIEEGVDGCLSFLANPKYEKYIYTTQSSVVLVNKDFVATQPISATLIRVADAYQSFALLLEMVAKSRADKKGVSKQVEIEPSAQIGENPYIGAFVYIGENVKIGNNVKLYPQVYIGDNVTVGDNSILFAGVKIYQDCVLGKNVTIHAGSVIGSDGFGFAPAEDGNYKKIPQLGNVILEDNVEIGANTTIDRAVMGSTIIRHGAKLDNLIQVAHNVEIGENTVIAAQTGVAGSTKIGKNCMIGGQVGFIGHLNIPDRVKIAAQSGITTSLKNEGEIVQGAPAFNFSKYQRSYAVFKNLPSLRLQVIELEKKVNAMGK